MIASVGAPDATADERATWPAVRLARAIRARELSSLELLDLYLDRIDRYDGGINAVVTLDSNGGRAAAAELDAAAARGEWRGALHGLPITVKDAIEVGGMRSTGGASELADHVPAADAPAVGRLRAAGAVVFGKTNCSRWSGDIQTYNSLFGTTTNPWASDRTPGGSSGGAAAAVAAGFTAFELGSDVGGSIRIPSHCCGVFGLKPTFGVVPQRGYLDRVDGGTTDVDINVFGPIARSAEDLDLVLGVLAGADEGDSVAWRLELPPAGDPSAFRVGVWMPEESDAQDPEQRTALEHALSKLTAAGVRLERSHPELDFDEQHKLFLTLLAAAISPSAPPDAPGMSHRTWLRADARRMSARRAWRQWFADFDVLLTPVMPTPAFPHMQDGDIADRTIPIGGLTRPYGSLVAWTGLVGLVGLPAAVAPVGITEGGLPVGMQVVTPPFRDRDAIAFAGLLARACDAGYRTPTLQTP